MKLKFLVLTIFCINFSSSAFADLFECRFESLYIKGNELGTMELKYDDGWSVKKKFNKTQLGYSYLLIEEIIANGVEERIYIDVILKRSITRDVFEADLVKKHLAMNNSCWDGCDNVTWGWEEKEKINGVCRLEKSNAN